MPNPIQKILKTQGFVVLDGALATELEARGASLKDELWSAKMLAENPGLIREVHHDYFLHGADIATTASYQATFEGFRRFGWDVETAVNLFKLSVQLTKEARALFWQEANQEERAWPLVAASVGPYGAMLADGSEYSGHYGLSVKALIDFHRPRLEVLLESEPDLLACETIPSLLEAEALIRLLEEYQEAWAWLSFSCCDEKHISDGATFREAVTLADSMEQVVAIGINCTAPNLISPLLESVQNTTSKPLVVYPNSGEGWDAVNKCWLPRGANMDRSKMAGQWYQKGARLIGGCCRTSPADIALIRKALKRSSAL